MYEFLNYCVCDAMTKDPVTLGPEATLAEAESIFEKRGFNALPVVGSEGEMLGLITQLDLLKAFRFTPDSVFPPYTELMQTPVEEVMTPAAAVVTVTPRTPLTRVLERMVIFRNKSFPVQEDGCVVGMVAREDLLEALRRAVSGQRVMTPI